VVPQTSGLVFFHGCCSLCEQLFDLVVVLVAIAVTSGRRTLSVLPGFGTMIAMMSIVMM
jgi:hypothetical protein